jgi:ABC-type Fe3+-citrate transport system substrate-binding protein
MKKSISEINDKLKQFNKKYKKSGLTDGKISQKAAMASLRGSDVMKHSDEHKKKISERFKGKPKSKEHIESLKNTKLKHKITKEQILEAQIGTTFAKEVAEKLGIDGHTYKAIATYHGVYNKKRDGNRLAQSKSTIHVWYYDKTKSDSKGEYFGKFISKSEAANACGIKMRTGITKVIKGECKQFGGFFFEEHLI